MDFANDKTIENSRSNAKTAPKPLTPTDAAELLAKMTVGSVLVVSETCDNARLVLVLVRTEHHGRPRWWSAPLQTAPFVSDAMFDIADLLGHSAAHAVLVGTDSTVRSVYPTTHSTAHTVTPPEYPPGVVSCFSISAAQRQMERSSPSTPTRNPSPSLNRGEIRGAWLQRAPPPYSPPRHGKLWWGIAAR